MVRKLYQGSLNGSRKGESGMNDKERLELIKKSVQNLLSLADSEGIGEVDITEVYEDMSWLIEKAEKVEQSQQEIEQLNNLVKIKESHEQQANNMVHLLEQQLKQAQAKIDRYKNTITETLELLKHGGPGTRSKVQFKLEQVCNELEGDTQ
jgi:DNA repair exonuclease SbcCD ATPase subunit